MKLTNKKLLATAVLTASGTQDRAAPVTYTVTDSSASLEMVFGGAYIGLNGTAGTSSDDAGTAPYGAYQANQLPSSGAYGFNISGTVTYDDTDGSVLDYNLLFNGGMNINAGGLVGYMGFLEATGDYVNGQGLTINQGHFDATFGYYPSGMIDLSSTQSFDESGNEILDGNGNSVPSALGMVAGSTFYYDASSILCLPPGTIVSQNPGFIVEAGGPLDGSPITINFAGYGTNAQDALNVSVGNAVLFGLDVPTNMGGSLTLQAVPVPAAAWLFGSALVGLAGIGRNRK